MWLLNRYNDGEIKERRAVKNFLCNRGVFGIRTEFIGKSKGQVVRTLYAEINYDNIEEKQQQQSKDGEDSEDKIVFIEAILNKCINENFKARN